MSSPAHFSLSRVTEADLPEVMKACWLSFPQVVQNLMLGCPTEADLPKLVEYHRKVLREHHHAVWIKVVENSTGKVAGAALWKIYPNAGAPASGDELPPPWLEGEDREASKKLLDVLNEGRRKANPDGFLREYLHSADRNRPGNLVLTIVDHYRPAHLIHRLGIPPPGRRGHDDAVGLRRC